MRKWLKSTECIRFNVENGTSRVTLNRPEKRNANGGGSDYEKLVKQGTDCEALSEAPGAHGAPLNTMWLYHLGPQWAKRLTLTGDALRGRDAARLGLVLKAGPAAKLDAEVSRDAPFGDGEVQRNDRRLQKPLNGPVTNLG